MHKQLSAKSPFWQIIFMSHFFGLLLVTWFTRPVASSSSNSIDIFVSPALLWVTLSLFIWTGLAGLACRTHNKTHPHRKISIFQTYPPELFGEDERNTAISASAAKAVYTYHNYAWPLVAFCIFLVHSTPVTVALIWLTLTIHYCVYWYHIRHLLAE